MFRFLLIRRLRDTQIIIYVPLNAMPNVTFVTKSETTSFPGNCKSTSHFAIAHSLEVDGYFHISLRSQRPRRAVRIRHAAIDESCSVTKPYLNDQNAQPMSCTFRYSLIPKVRFVAHPYQVGDFHSGCLTSSDGLVVGRGGSA